MKTPNTIWELIQKITPLYNSYTQNSNTINWTDALEIIREIWAILNNYLKNYNVAPHNLYRQIYWKWEWKTNIEQKSYITREFLWRSYRIFKIFPNKSDIRKDLATLISFTVFREAMPFFDNPKCILVDKEKNELLKLLNSNYPKNKLIAIIRKKLKDHLWKFNPRTQKLWEMDTIKQSFISLYKYIKDLFNENYSEINKILDKNWLTKESIKKISTNINALTDDSFRMNNLDFDDSLNEPWLSLVKNLNEFANEKTVVKRRRVRKIIDPLIIVHIADMVLALSSEEYFNNFKSKSTKR